MTISTFVPFVIILLLIFIACRAIYLYAFSYVPEEKLYETGKKIGNIHWLHWFGYVNTGEIEQLQEILLVNGKINQINKTLDDFSKGKMAIFLNDYNAFMKTDSGNEN